MDISQKMKNVTTHDLAMSFLDIYFLKNPTMLIKKTHVPQCSLKHTIHQDMKAT